MTMYVPDSAKSALEPYRSGGLIVKQTHYVFWSNHRRTREDFFLYSFCFKSTIFHLYAKISDTPETHSIRSLVSPDTYKLMWWKEDRITYTSKKSLNQDAKPAINWIKACNDMNKSSSVSHHLLVRCYQSSTSQNHFTSLMKSLQQNNSEKQRFEQSILHSQRL